MSTERPWHTKAREMRAEGATYTTIAAALDMSEVTICRFFNPAYKARQVEHSNTWHQRREATDPAYKERRKGYRQKYAKRQRAYRVAAETGVPVEQVWAEWGVA